MAKYHINKIKSDLDNAIDIMKDDPKVQALFLNDLKGATICLPRIAAYWNKEEQYLIVGRNDVPYILEEWFHGLFGFEDIQECVCIGSYYSLIQEVSDDNAFAEEFLAQIEDMIDEYNLDVAESKAKPVIDNAAYEQVYGNG